MPLIRYNIELYTSSDNNKLSNSQDELSLFDVSSSSQSNTASSKVGSDKIALLKDISFQALLTSVIFNLLSYNGKNQYSHQEPFSSLELGNYGHIYRVENIEDMSEEDTQELISFRNEFWIEFICNGKFITSIKFNISLSGKNSVFSKEISCTIPLKELYTQLSTLLSNLLESIQTDTERKTLYIPSNSFCLDAHTLTTLTQPIEGSSYGRYPGFLVNAEWYEFLIATSLESNMHYTDDSWLASQDATRKVWLKIVMVTKKIPEYNETIYPILEATLYTPNTIFNDEFPFEQTPLHTKLTSPDNINYDSIKREWISTALTHVAPLTRAAAQKEVLSSQSSSSQPLSLTGIAQNEAILYPLIDSDLSVFFDVILFESKASESKGSYIRIIDSEFGVISINRISPREEDNDLYSLILRMLYEHIFSLWGQKETILKEGALSEQQYYVRMMKYNLALVILWAKHLKIEFNLSETSLNDRNLEKEFESILSSLNTQNRSNSGGILTEVIHRLSSVTSNEETVTCSFNDKLDNIINRMQKDIVDNITSAGNKQKVQDLLSALTNLKEKLPKNHLLALYLQENFLNNVNEEALCQWLMSENDSDKDQLKRFCDLLDKMCTIQTAQHKGKEKVAVNKSKESPLDTLLGWLPTISSTSKQAENSEATAPQDADATTAIIAFNKAALSFLAHVAPKKKKEANTFTSIPSTFTAPRPSKT